jgi:hypothetical protein
MKTYIFSSLFCSGALFLASCTGLGGGPSGNHNGQNGGPSGPTDGGLDMGVTMSGLTSDQTFCMSWTLYQDDGQGGWYAIDQREEPVCGDAGDLSLTDFATCYDGKHFLVQYDISVRDSSGEIASASATSGGGPNDVCIKNVDTPTAANIQFNNEGSAGGVNPGIDIDQVCSNNKLVEENGELVSALWLQPDNCELPGSPDSYCILGSGSGIETQRTGLTLDGSTRFIFSTSALDATWDLIYMSPDPAQEGLSIVSYPFALHHASNAGVLTNEELVSLGSFQLGKTLGLVRVDGNKVIITSDADANCDGNVDLGASTQVIELPDSCEAIGMVATGSSSFDIIYRHGSEILSTSCDANNAGDAICN